MDKCKEKIKQVCKYAKKAHSKDAIAFLQEDVYREIYLGEEVKEDEKVTNLKQAINNVDQKTYEFKELISSLSKLYNNSSKIEHDTKTFNALMDKISSLPVKEQYIAKGLMKASQIAVEKTQNAQEEQLQSSNENIQKPDILYRNKIIEFGNSGLSAEDIVKALNLNPNKTKEIEEILIENQKSLVAKNKNNIIDLGNNGLSAEEIAKKLKLDPITKKDIQKILNENVKTME